MNAKTVIDEQTIMRAINHVRYWERQIKEMEKTHEQMRHKGMVVLPGWSNTLRNYRSCLRIAKKELQEYIDRYTQEDSWKG